MAGKLLVEVTNPVTQTIDSVKTLAKFLGLSDEMPEKISLAKGACMKHRRDLAQATREKPEPRLRRMIKAAKDSDSSKLELFGSKPFKPVLE
jgi:ABC-type Fe3+-citrate transport system substrate-binding protein